MPAVQSKFDPFSQQFTWRDDRGKPFNLTITDLDDFYFESVNSSINYGAQVGASVIMLLVVLLLTKEDKRRSPIFFLNSLSLAISFVRSILFATYFTSGFSRTYAYFGGDYSRVPRGDYANGVAQNVLTLLLLITIEISLALQTQVVTVLAPRVWRVVLAIFSAIFVLQAIGFRFATCILSSRAILNASSFGHYRWLVKATQVTATLSICFFCCVFTSKLGYALRKRYQLGLPQFGPMQILFLMGFQTMLLPAIFSILQSFVKDKIHLSTNILTLTALLLPLSSLWASSSVKPNHSKMSDASTTSARTLFGSQLSSHSSSKFATFATLSNGSRSMHGRKASTSGPETPANPLSSCSVAPVNPESFRTSVIAQDSAEKRQDADEKPTGAGTEGTIGVQVEQTFGVRKESA